MTNLIFDYDGTLHESLIIYAPAFREALRYLAEKELTSRSEYSDDEISRWIGLAPPEMWRRFAPELPEAERDICSGKIGDELLRLTRAGKASLYPRVEETLGELKRRGYNLIFLSNCKASYMEAHRRFFNLDRFFAAYYCSEDYGFIPKYEIFGCIKEEWPGDYVVVGDTRTDMEIAERNGLKSIGCLYGYGKPGDLRSADFLIDNPESLLEIPVFNLC